MYFEFPETGNMYFDLVVLMHVFERFRGSLYLLKIMYSGGVHS